MSFSIIVVFAFLLPRCSSSQLFPLASVGGCSDAGCPSKAESRQEVDGCNSRVYIHSFLAGHSCRT